MSLFDYFVAPAQQYQRRFDDEYLLTFGEKKRRRDQLLPPPSPTNPRSGYAPIHVEEPTASLAPDLATRERVVQTPPPAPTRDPIEELRARRRRLSDPDDPNFQPVKDNDKSFWKKLASIGRELVVQSGSNYRDSAQYARYMTPEERLLGALGAGIGGAAYEGIAGTADETRQRVYDLERLDRKEAELLRQQEANQKLLQGKIKSAQDLQALALGQPVEVIDPATGQPVLVKGSEAYSQGNQNLRQATGIAATNERDALNRKSRENIAAASREQQLEIERSRQTTAADKYNIDNIRDEQKEFNRRVDSWLKRQQEKSLEISKLIGETGAGAAEAQQYAQIVSERVETVQGLMAAMDAETSTAKRGQLQRTIDLHTRAIDTARNKLITILGKSKASVAAVEALKSQDEPRPERSKTPRLKPTLPQGRRVSSSRDPLGLFK